MNQKNKFDIPHVKIVATFGPASSDKQTIRLMIEAGLDVARLNFSHGTHDEHRQIFSIIKEEAKRSGHHIAILGDLCGPKIRTGKIKNGFADLKKDSLLSITCEDIEGDDLCISTSYKNLDSDVKSGDVILIDDGRIKLVVQSSEVKNVCCIVKVGGKLYDHKGMNFPGTVLSVNGVTDKDRDDIAFARELGVDYLALSFVRKAADVMLAKKLAVDIPIIAKIEKPEAITNLNEIIAVADGLMVARGDLSVEVGAEKVPLLQKRIIHDAAKAQLPVIVATQMMESMIEDPEPTRAEVSDVANAVFDGTDAVMLSGETAVGKYPVETIRKMSSIITEVEKSEILQPAVRTVNSMKHDFSSAVACAAVAAGHDFALKAIAIYTETGKSAALISSYRPVSVIAAFSRHHVVLRRLALRWGVILIFCEWLTSSDEMVIQAKNIYIKMKSLYLGKVLLLHSEFTSRVKYFRLILSNL